MERVLAGNQDAAFYAVKVNGQLVGPPRASLVMAEQDISHLSDEHQMIAEVVRVTTDGLELLLG